MVATEEGSLDAATQVEILAQRFPEGRHVRFSRQLVTMWRRGGLRLFVGGGIIVLLAIIALGEPMLTPYDPVAADFGSTLEGPSSSHWLGTDPVGRDVLSRIIAGSRLAFLVGIVAVSTSLVIGLVLGLAAGYVGGWVDTLVMLVVNSLLAMPLLVVALAIVTAFDRSLLNIMVAIGIASSPSIARVVRAQVLSARESVYVEAARVVGAHDLRIVARHIMPNIIAPLIVLASLRLASAILAEASLSFLGLGVPPPEPSWGSMANYGREYFSSAPWLVFGPIGAIFVTVLAWNFFGDGLRDYLDPRLRR